MFVLLFGIITATHTTGTHKDRPELTETYQSHLSPHESLLGALLALSRPAVFCYLPWSSFASNRYSPLQAPVNASTGSGILSPVKLSKPSVRELLLRAPFLQGGLEVRVVGD